MTPQLPPPAPNFLPRPSRQWTNLGAVEGDYLRNLKSIQSDSLRRAWIEGDMAALSGGYFRSFRPNGKMMGEPDNARHVYDPATTRIESHWALWASGDWGFIHPSDFMWHRRSPWGQIYTFKEISLNRVEPFELGVLIARESMPLLLGLKVVDPHMNLFLSPDAFARKESENPIAHQMAKGIDSVMGSGSAFLMNLEEAEKQMDPAAGYQAMLRRREGQRSARISLIRASTDRVAGFMHMQSLLRFNPLMPVSDPDMEFAHKLYEEHGLVAYQQYLNQPEFAKGKEVLPVWQISRECGPLIEAMRKAMHKPGTNDVESWNATESSAGDDALDDARYGLLSEHLQGASVAPLEERISTRAEVILTPGMSDYTRSQVIAAAARKERGDTPSQKREFGHNRVAVMRALRSRAGVMTQREPHMRRRVGPPEATE